MAPTLSIPVRSAKLLLLGTMLLSIAQVTVAAPAGSLVEAPARVRRVFVDDMGARGSKVRRGKGWEEQNWSSWGSDAVTTATATDATATSIEIPDFTQVASFTGVFSSGDAFSSTVVSSGDATFTTDDSSTWATSVPAPCPPASFLASSGTDAGLSDITGTWTMIPGATAATGCDASYWSSTAVETAVSSVFSYTDVSFTETGIDTTVVFPTETFPTATDASFTDAYATSTAFAFSGMPSITEEICVISFPLETADATTDASFYGTATYTGDVSATGDIWATSTGGAYTIIYATVTVTECPFMTSEPIATFTGDISFATTATDDVSFATTATDVFFSGTATDDSPFATSTDIMTIDATTAFVQIRPDATEAPGSSITGNLELTTFKTVTAPKASKH